MAISWNMDFADLAVADFQDKAFVAMFVAAMLERGVDLSASFGPFTKGFNLQDKSFWLAIQALFDFGFGAVGWMRPDADLSGINTKALSGSNIPFITQARFENDLGFYNASNGPGNPFATPPFLPPSDTTGWPAHRSKQFGSFTAADDGTGGDFKLDDLYRKLDDGFVYRRSTATTTVHDETGWQKVSNVVPTVRSKLDDAVDIYFGSDSYEVEVGDYMFTSLFTGMRDATNYLIVSAVFVTTAAISGYTGWIANGVDNSKQGSGFDTTWAGAEAAAEAAFASTGQFNNMPIAIYTGSNGYAAQIDRRRAQMSVATPADGLTPTIQFYAFAQPPDRPGDGANTQLGTFDANGDTIGNHALALFDTKAADGVGTTIISVMLGTLAVPNQPGDPTAHSTAKGYAETADFGLDGILLGIRYDVAGGFVYR